MAVKSLLGIDLIIAGSGITIDNTDPLHPIISAGGGGVSIGGTVTGGTANSILFINPAATLAQNTGFTYSSNTLGLTNSGTQSIQFGPTTNTDDITMSYVPGNAQPFQVALNGTFKFGLTSNDYFQISSINGLFIAGTSILFQGSTNLTRNGGNGAMVWTIQNNPGADFGVVLGSAAAKQYVRAATSPSVNVFEIQDTSGVPQSYFTPSFGLVTPSALVADVAYSVAWDGSFLVPTRNAVYDKIQSLVTGVSSVTAGDTTLTISPTTGAVIASLNLANANTWTASQKFIFTAGPQMRIGYDVSNYFDINVDSAGLVTLDTSGGNFSLLDGFFAQAGINVSTLSGSAPVNGEIGMYGSSIQRRATFSQDGIVTRAVGMFKWTAGSTITSPDTGVARNAAGVVEINNGTAGTLRDITVRELFATSTTEPMRLQYDASNYMTAIVSSAGLVTFNAVGSGTPSFTFGNGVILPASTTSIASLNIPSGVAPSAPAPGDIWYDGVQLQARVNGITTPIPATVAKVNLTAQAAAISATTAYAVPANGAGLYLISWVATITQTATSSCVLGSTSGFQARFTKGGVVKTTNPQSVTNFTSIANSTGTAISASLLMSCDASTNIQYLMGYSSTGATAMQYSLDITVQKLTN